MVIPREETVPCDMLSFFRRFSGSRIKSKSLLRIRSCLLRFSRMTDFHRRNASSALTAPVRVGHFTPFPLSGSPSGATEDLIQLCIWGKSSLRFVFYKTICARSPLSRRNISYFPHFGKRFPRRFSLFSVSFLAPFVGGRNLPSGEARAPLFSYPNKGKKTPPVPVRQKSTRPAFRQNK